MGRLKIKQEDNSKEVVAYISDIQPVATDLDNLIDDVDDKIGVLNSLTTTEKSNLTDAVSEVKNELVNHKLDYANLNDRVDKRTVIPMINHIKNGNFKKLHDKEIERIKSSNNKLISSMGI